MTLFFLQLVNESEVLMDGKHSASLDDRGASKDHLETDNVGESEASQDLAIAHSGYSFILIAYY